LQVDDPLRESRATGIYGEMWYAPTGEVYVRACGVIEDSEEVCTNLH
jgi:hypothetical protein